MESQRAYVQSELFSVQNAYQEAQAGIRQSAEEIEQFEKTKEEIPILGKTGKGNKSTGWKGTGSATFHYNASIFREMMAEYKDTGKDIYFDIAIENCDPTSDAGYQIVILKDCNIDGGILAKFDADGGYLDEDMDFTFEDFEIVHNFTHLPGFIIND